MPMLGILEAVRRLVYRLLCLFLGCRATQGLRGSKLWSTSTHFLSENTDEELFSGKYIRFEPCGLVWF